MIGVRFYAAEVRAVFSRSPQRLHKSSQSDGYARSGLAASANESDYVSEFVHVVTSLFALFIRLPDRITCDLGLHDSLPRLH